MFDPTDMFEREFIPFADGYLYYLSHKSGGKFVTSDEYTKLINDFRRLMGWRGRAKIIVALLIVVLLWLFFLDAMILPPWSDRVMIATCMTGIMGWSFWVGTATRRLVRGRPDVAPPRPLAIAKKQSRALLNWPFVFFALVFSGGGLFGAWASPGRTLHWWAALIGSGLIFTAYVWIAIRKLLDRKS